MNLIRRGITGSVYKSKLILHASDEDFIYTMVFSANLCHIFKLWNAVTL